MFDMKVSVSLAKYDKDHKRINYASDFPGRSVWRPKGSYQDNNNKQSDAEKQPSDYGQSGPSFVQEGRSYADLLKGNKEVQGHGAKVVNVEGKGSLYPLHCIGRFVIGYTKVVMTVSKVRLSLEEEGLTDVGLSYVGGLTYMLTFKDKASATGCMELHANFFHNIFSDFYLWNGEDIPYNRIVTLIISRVPFIIRDNTLFDKIGGLFGKVIKQSSFSWQDEDNSFGSVMVLTTQKSKIEEALVIKWNDKSIIAWASESVEQYMPNLDNGSVMDDSESELDTDSDEDLEDVVDFEEGEIRPNVSSDGDVQACEQNPASEVGALDAIPVELESAPGDKETPVGQAVPNINACMGKQNVHGDMNESARETCNYEVAMDKVNNSHSNNDRGNGPIGLESDVVFGQPNLSSGDDGPTPVINLGKRAHPLWAPLKGPLKELLVNLIGWIGFLRI
ncbi:hypothetical protein Hdeb2414_s0008g00280721 [Helianthus debilis subsp. tardiflorus]